MELGSSYSDCAMSIVIGVSTASACVSLNGLVVVSRRNCVESVKCRSCGSMNVPP